MKFVKFSYLATLYGSFLTKFDIPVGVKFNPANTPVGVKIHPRNLNLYPFWSKVPYHPPLCIADQTGKQCYNPYANTCRWGCARRPWKSLSLPASCAIDSFTVPLHSPTCLPLGLCKETVTWVWKRWEFPLAIMQWGTRQSQPIFRQTNLKNATPANWRPCLIDLYPTDSPSANRRGPPSQLTTSEKRRD